MMNKLKPFLFTTLCSLITAFAMFNTGPNCIGILYKPETPKSLIK